jgi:quinol monooxygenase YgiN
VEAPSRALPGVIHFDVARSLTDSNTFVVVEVFEDRQALERQEAQAEVAAVLKLVESGALARDFEWTVWETGDDQGSAYSWM